MRGAFSQAREAFFLKMFKYFPKKGKSVKLIFPLL